MKVLKPMNFDQSGRIAVLFNGRQIFIDINKILYCEACGNYCTIHLNDGKLYTDSNTLKCLRQQLQEFGFFPIDKSVIINLLHIQSITQERNAKVMLSDCFELKVARDRKKELMEILFGFWYMLITGDLLSISFL